MSERLKFWCSPRPFRVPQGDACHRETVGRLTVFEYHVKDQANPYGLVMEAQVSSQDELRECRDEALGLAGDLNKVWPYAAGVPLFPPRTSMRVSREPLGWGSNGDQLEEVLPGARFKINIGPTVGEFGIELPFMPLQRALEVLRAYRATDPLTLSLLRMHFQAMENAKGDLELFLLAKLLELVAALLPGRTMAQKQSVLGADYVQLLRHSMNWLAQISNTRLDLRHAVASKDPTTVLHPKLTSEERQDFVHDADIVVRAVVALRLGIDVPTLNRK